MKIKNQNGFTAIEGILSALLVVAVGAAGYFAYQGHQDRATDTAGGVAQTTKTAADPYKGWKTYNTAQENSSLKYPADWKITKDIDTSATLEDGRRENLTFTSPSGFALEYYGYPSGLGGGCEPADCPTTHTTSKEKRTILGKSVYLVHQVVTNTDNTNLKIVGFINADAQNTGLSADYKGFPPYYSFTGRHGDVMISGSYKVGSPKNDLSATDFFELDDAKNATLILESLKYN